jgi:hypothetical protein
MTTPAFDEKAINPNKANFRIKLTLPSKEEIERIKEQVNADLRAGEGFGTGLIFSIAIWIIIALAIMIARN